MFMIPKEIYSRVISSLTSDQKRRVDEINVDQVNVTCGPLFAGLKKGKKSGQKRTLEKLVERGRDSSKVVENEKENLEDELRTEDSSPSQDPIPKKRRGDNDGKKKKKEKEKKKPKSKNRALREKSLVKTTGTVVVVEKNALKSPAKSAESSKISGGRQSRPAKITPSLKKSPIKKSASRKKANVSGNKTTMNVSATRIFNDPNYVRASRSSVMQHPEVYRDAKNASTIIARANNRDSAESAIWGDILSPEQKRDKARKEKEVSQAWRNKRVMGLSDIQEIQREKEKSNKKKKKSVPQPLNSTALGAISGVNDTVSNSIFDKDTILVPKTPSRENREKDSSAEEQINREINISPESNAPYGDVEKLFNNDFRGESRKSAESSVNEDILGRLSVPENAQETLEIQRGLNAGTPRSVQKLAERFVTPEKSAQKKSNTPQGSSMSPSSLMEISPPPPPQFGVDSSLSHVLPPAPYGFGRSSKVARSPPGGKVTTKSFYGTLSPPKKAGSLTSKNKNVTTRKQYDNLAAKEREKKKNRGINVPG